MIGSEKQIEWAKRLKSDAEENIKTALEYGVEDTEEFVKYWNIIKDIESAVFWIEMKANLGASIDPKYLHDCGIRKGMMGV